MIAFDNLCIDGNRNKYSIKQASLHSIWLILARKLKLNCRDLQRVTVMTSSSYYVSKLHVIVEYSFMFPSLQKL